jgi:hypothetical protein
MAFSQTKHLGTSSLHLLGIFLGLFVVRLFKNIYCFKNNIIKARILSLKGQKKKKLGHFGP